jgi:hypothetical protein
MWKKVRPKPDERRVCAFCNDDKEDEGIEPGSSGMFIGDDEQGFVLSSSEGKRTKIFAHENCAKYNPDVFKIGSQWYNVAHVLAKRGKKIKCRRCHYRGATLGCFAPECDWSFHVRCTGQKASEFASGKVFWCAKHDPTLLGGFQESYSCDSCGTSFGEPDEFYTCLSCREQNAFSSVDVCKSCFVTKRTAGGVPDVGHVSSHKIERWGLTSFKAIEEEKTDSKADIKTERNKLMGKIPT